MQLLENKQWGTADERKSNISQTIHFPIAFSNTSYGFVLGEINIYQADNIGSRVLSKTMSNMVIYGWDYTTTSWLVLGIQQWGNITTAVNDGTVTFPIAYVTSTYFATVDPMSDGNYHTNNVAIYNRTNNSFDFEFYQGHIIRAWFAIGY